MLEYRYKGRAADIQVHLTNHCDHLCAHCYTSSTDAQHPWLPIEIFEDVLSFARREPARIIRLVGGEVVTLGLDLLPYVAAAGKSQVPVILSTNGYTCDVWEEERLDPSSFREIIVSCYGFQDAHEHMTQVPGSYHRTQRTIEYLASRGHRQFEVTVNTLVTPANLKEFREFLRYLASVGVDEVKVLVLSPLGHAVGPRAGYTRDYVSPPARQRIREQVQVDLRKGALAALRIAWESGNAYSAVQGECLVGSEHSALAASQVQLPVCRLHKESMLTVAVSGAVYPCHLMINQRHFAIGNLHDQCAADVWQGFVHRGGGTALEDELLRKYSGCPAYLGRPPSRCDTSVGMPKVCPLHLELLSSSVRSE